MVRGLTFLAAVRASISQAHIALEAVPRTEFARQSRARADPMDQSRVDCHTTTHVV
jgi:hypothetical protein